MSGETSWATFAAPPLDEQRKVSFRLATVVRGFILAEGARRAGAGCRAAHIHAAHGSLGAEDHSAAGATHAVTTMTDPEARNVGQHLPSTYKPAASYPIGSDGAMQARHPLFGLSSDGPFARVACNVARSKFPGGSANDRATRGAEGGGRC